MPPAADDEHATARDPLIGATLHERYRIETRIARGGMANVYEGSDLRLGRQVAIKVMHHGLGDAQAFGRRFVREAQSAAGLSHPNIVQVFDQGRDGDTVYLVMEYVPGRTLRDVIRDEAPLSPTQALQYIEPVLDALSAAHHDHLVHRDIKPENVLIGGRRVKVADFGLAQAIHADSQHSTTGSVLIGSVSYLAPELVTNRVADARADVYAAGVLLYELLTGVKPHRGDSPLQVAYQHVHEDVPAPSQSVEGLDASLDALVRDATARNLDHRLPDAEAMLSRVHECQDQLGGTEQTLTEIPAVVPAAKRRRPRWLVLLLIVALILGLGGAGWWFSVGRYTTTPDVVDLTEEQAVAKLESAGLKVSSAESEYSETIAEGHVLRTDPEGGDRVLSSGTVEVTLSRGPERYPVPKLRSLSEDEAQDKLQGTELKFGKSTLVFAPKMKEGLVVRTKPKAGKQVAPGTEVNLLVSKGPKPIQVPDVVGMTQAEATQRLDSLDVKIDYSSEFSDSVSEGTVISQSPSSSETVLPGETVSIVVSKGPELVSVPSLIGRRTADAQQTLEDLGLRVRVENAPTYLGLGYVQSSDPSRGSQVPKGSLVTLYQL